MEKKEFLEITKNILSIHGFKKIKSHYYLDLPNVIIKLNVGRNRFCNEELYFSIVLSIKALSSCPEEICFSIENTHNLNAPYLFSNPKLFKVFVPDDSDVSQSILQKGNCYFNPNNYTITQWEEIFREIVHRYFDPFKKDAFQAIKDANEKRQNNLFFAMRPEIANYIGVKKY